MENFIIQDTDNKQLITDTHYYKWLLANKPTDIHSSKTKLSYLEDCGFIVNTHRITEENISTLRAIETVYFDLNIKPRVKN